MAVTLKKNSLEIPKGSDLARNLYLRTKRKSREIPADELKDLSTLRRRQQIKMTILRNQRKDEKFRSDIKELKENLGLIKARMDMITTYRLAKRKQTNFQKKICQARRNFWKELPHIEHFFVCAACVMFASLLCLYLVRALVLLLLPQIFLECHPNISQVLKYKINSSLCS